MPYFSRTAQQLFRSESLHCVFWSLEIERRSLVAARLKPTKTTQDTEAVQIRDQVLLKPFNAVEADLIRAGVGEIDAIRLVVSVEGVQL